MISEDEVRRIAALARLELGAEELARMQRDLARILDFVDQISEVDRSGAQRAPFPGGDDSGTENGRPDSGAPENGAPENGARCAPLREDDALPSLDHGDVASNAPRFLAAHFVVPRILGGGS